MKVIRFGPSRDADLLYGPLHGTHSFCDALQEPYLKQNCTHLFFSSLVSHYKPDGQSQEAIWGMLLETKCLVGGGASQVRIL